MICQPIHQKSITSSDIPSFIRYCEQGNRYDSLISIIPDGLKYPVYIRRATSDVYNFLQVFEEREYDNITSAPNTVVDLGAYVGYVAVYFATKYGSKVTSIEPDLQNYMMLLLNTSPYQSINCINAGIWNSKCKLKISEKVGGDWGAIIDEHSGGNINGITMVDVIRDFHISDIDFLKIDIEGSERDLFKLGTYENWVDIVKIVHCETHDRFRKGSSDAYRSAFNNERYSCEIINQAERYHKLEIR